MKRLLIVPFLASALLIGCGGSGGEGDGGSVVASPTTSIRSPTRTFTPTPTPTATRTPTPTPTPLAPCSESTVRIVGLDKAAEIVTLSGVGDLTGWHILSETGGQAFHFPKGFKMTGALVQVFSGKPEFGSNETQLWWTPQNVWNNSDPDPAVLYCQGNVMQRFGR
jgi:hypothetical protein